MLDSLRQPLESGAAVIARANAHVTYPARIQLVAAMNPCRCGYAYELGRACRRGAHCTQDYQSKISGPLMDRIDLHINMPPVSAADLTLPPPSEGSAAVAARVAQARDIQTLRYAAYDTSAAINAEADGKVLEAVAAPDKEGRTLLANAVDAMGLSARAITGCCAWRARWRIWPASMTCAASTLPKRSITANRPKPV